MFICNRPGFDNSFHVFSMFFYVLFQKVRLALMNMTGPPGGPVRALIQQRPFYSHGTLILSHYLPASGVIDWILYVSKLTNKKQ